MKTKKKLLIAVASISLVLHAIGIYLLCEMSITKKLISLSKNPFHLQWRGFQEVELKEVARADALLNRETAREEKSLSQSFDALLSLTEEKSPMTDGQSRINLLSDSIVFQSPEQMDQTSLVGSSELSRYVMDFHFDREKPDKITESDHFTYQLEYAPRRYRGGYVFKISLYPKRDIAFQRMRQNFFFLVDRSNSIPRGRYFLNKKAISAILPSLQPQDRFNILVFDDKVVRLSNELLDCSPENIERARQFLENLGHGGYFSSTDIYASLGKILPRLVSDSEINTAILLSDGDTYLTVENQRLLIRNWSLANDGKVTLFCFASGTGNNLTLLETIAAFNKGAFVYVADHNQIEERLRTLIQSLRHPIGKEIVISSLSMQKKSDLHLLPKRERLPDLYQHRPYVIYGVINRLEDFTLFLQGKFYNRLFDIRKKISFSGARFGSLDLERKYTALLAQDYFEQFFKDGKMVHLEEAKRLLAPLDMAAPFLRQ